jgi:predicted aminopeptidase
MEKYRLRLQALYKTHLPAPEMRARKAAAFADLKDEYRQLKQSWGGFAGYDHWFAREPNNAMLASIGLYTKRVPAFEALFAREGRDLERFYIAAKALARMGKVERTAALESLMPRTAAAESPTPSPATASAESPTPSPATASAESPTPSPATATATAH